jgi:[ribosomal protein S5]-alanine N-acetyltransferase
MYSKRLKFEIWKEEDENFLYEHYTNEKVLKYMEEQRIKNKEEVKNIIKEFNTNFEKNKYSMLKIKLKENEEIIGVGGCFNIFSNENGRVDELNESDKNEEIEIGFDFSPKYWGNGYATETTLFWIQYLKELNISINKVVAYVDIENIVSQKVLLKCGFLKVNKKFKYLKNSNDCYRFEFNILESC